MIFYATPGLINIREYTLREIVSPFLPAFSTPHSAAEWMVAQGAKDKIMHAQLNVVLDTRAFFALIFFLGIIPPLFGIVESLGMVWSKSKHDAVHKLEGLLPAFLIIAYYFVIFKYSDLLWTHPALSQLNVAPFFTGTCARLIVSTVAKAKFTILDEVHLSLPFIASLLVFPINKRLELGLNEYNVYLMLIVGNFFTYFLYVLNAIDQIKNSLGIYCLTIKPKDSTKKVK